MPHDLTATAASNDAARPDSAAVFPGDSAQRYTTEVGDLSPDELTKVGAYDVVREWRRSSGGELVESVEDQT